MEGTYQDWLFRVYHVLESERMIEKSTVELPKCDTTELQEYDNNHRGNQHVMNPDHIY